MIDIVRLSKKAQKDLMKVPRHIQSKLKLWVALVEHQGIDATRQIPGFHDKPLKGQREGQRSIRLNKAYRAIYVERKEGTIEFVSIEEVHKHEY